MIKRKGYFLKKRIFQKEQLSKEGKEHQVKNERRNFWDNHKKKMDERDRQRQMIQMRKIQLWWRETYFNELFVF